MRFILALFVVLLLPSFGFSSEVSDSSKRVALVIGNGSYANSPLKNPVNDAKDMATKLRKLGFEVIERNDLTTRQIGGTLREFRSKLSPGAVALVFYAGHGLQIKGDNYLPAVDADISSEEDIPNQSLAMKQIMDVLDESKSRLNLVFLDACRNNPYARSFRSADRGLARVNAPSGTLISYATKPGSVAADGTGRNGLYTSKLLAQLDSNLQIEQALKRVVTEVKTASKGKQEPWMEGSIEGDFCFGGCGANSAANNNEASKEHISITTRLKSHEEIEQEAWESARDSNKPGAIQEYLNQYPKGRFAGQAKVVIATLGVGSEKKIQNEDSNPFTFLEGDWKCVVANKSIMDVRFTVRGDQVSIATETKDGSLRSFAAIYTAEIANGILTLSGRSTSNPELNKITTKYKVLNDRNMQGYFSQINGVKRDLNNNCQKE